ncbi:fimbrial protein [Salmonella enterica]|nr:fimbrial protein [Salmonella enterica]
MRPTSFIIRPTFALFAALAFAPSAQAGDIDVQFKAKIRATTCDMSIGGGSGGGDGAATTIPFGDVLLSDIINHRTDTAFHDATMQQFSLDIDNCPDSLNGIKTVITGVVPADPTILMSSSTEEGAAGGVGVQFSRLDEMENHFKIFGVTNPSGSGAASTEVINWTEQEISNKKVDMVAHLVTFKATADNTDIGSLQATATFNFTYE